MRILSTSKTPNINWKSSSRDLCDNCGKQRRLRKAKDLYLCRPCFQAMKAKVLGPQ
jgi:ribosomal protein S14